jgi:hypothetical protein
MKIDRSALPKEALEAAGRTYYNFWVGANIGDDEWAKMHENYKRPYIENAFLIIKTAFDAAT